MLLSWSQKLKLSIKTKLRSIFNKTDDSFEELWPDIEEVLLNADCSLDSIDIIKNKLIKNLGPKNVTQEDLIYELKDIIYSHVVLLEHKLDLSAKPNVIMMLGSNGAGKTTTIGKLTKYLKNKQLSILLAAGDKFRAAAVNQIQSWATSQGVEIISNNNEAASIAYDAINISKSKNIDVLIFDTAGRLHNNKNLLQELAKIKRVMGKAMESAPHHRILVVDASTGRSVMAQLEAFNAYVDISSIIVTKLDSSAKGGFIISMAMSECIKPISFIGLGDNVDDIAIFDAKEFTNSLFD